MSSQRSCGRLPNSRRKTKVSAVHTGCSIQLLRAAVALIIEQSATNPRVIGLIPGSSWPHQGVLCQDTETL